MMTIQQSETIRFNSVFIHIFFEPHRFTKTDNDLKVSEKRLMILPRKIINRLHEASRKQATTRVTILYWLLFIT